MDKETLIQVEHLHRYYGHTCAVRDVSFDLAKGEVLGFLGPNGAGKTTLMRLLVGLIRPDAGKIEILGQDVSAISESELRRIRAQQIGMVFQDYALFPHLSIFDNVAFGLKSMDKATLIRRVNEALELVGLYSEHARFPHEISGGQQQRVALARALAPKPQLLFMDEPFSNLDVTLRERLSMEVRDILKEYGTTALFVTHNQHEAFAVADRIGVMHNGEILQWDSAHNLYHQPASPQIANFVGEGALIKGVVRDKGKVETGLGLLAGIMTDTTPEETTVQLLVRPEDILHNDDSQITAKVLRRNFRGANIMYTLLLENGDKVQALVPSHCDHQPGENIGIQPDVRHLVLFPIDLQKQQMTTRTTQESSRHLHRR